MVVNKKGRVLWGRLLETGAGESVMRGSLLDSLGIRAVGKLAQPGDE